MGAAKRKKVKEALINRSIWILKSLLGIVIGHLDRILDELTDEVSEDTKNDIRVINNSINRIDERIFGSKMNKCSETTKADYNYFYLEIEAKIDELME